MGVGDEARERWLLQSPPACVMEMDEVKGEILEGGRRVGRGKQGADGLEVSDSCIAQNIRNLS